MANVPDAHAQVRAATRLLHRYESALNAADVDAIVALYAADGVFMAQHRPPAVGRAPIEAAYREILGMIRLDIDFEIDEVVVVTPTVAYARTRSAGTTTVLANDTQVAEGNQELFVLVRAAKSPEWRIARYIFSTTRPRS
ncbi:MAG: SgcJ/EcaC family oxidoreductase [Myxococcales bacterium]|nr:SgcJ/EcaC family oxidoreductase [Myxococcales bacterium]MCB9536797.1 SgcJ/EcaC family oxidoreductase [Myxococcales bacterium]